MYQQLGLQILFLFKNFKHLFYFPTLLSTHLSCCLTCPVELTKTYTSFLNPDFKMTYPL